MDKLKARGKGLAQGLGLGSLVGVMYEYNPPGFISFLNTALQYQIVNFTLGFMLVAWWHRKGQRKDAASVTGAIEKLGDALRADLGKMNLKIDQTIERVDRLEGGKNG